jgi:hypothetical protein
MEFALDFETQVCRPYTWVIVRLINVMLQSFWGHNAFWTDVFLEIRIFMLLLNFNGQATGYTLTKFNPWQNVHKAFVQPLRTVSLWQCSCSRSVNRHKVMRTSWAPSMSLTPQSYPDPTHTVRPSPCRSHLYIPVLRYEVARMSQGASTLLVFVSFAVIFVSCVQTAPSVYWNVYTEFKNSRRKFINANCRPSLSDEYLKSLLVISSTNFEDHLDQFL